MMRPIVLLAACLLAAAVFGGEGRRWLAPDADYRLSVRPERADEATAADLRRQVLPVLPETGVRVFDDTGAPAAFQLHDSGMLAIAPAPNAKSFDIYFGFKEAQPADAWKPESGPRVPAMRLLLSFYWGGDRPCTPEEFLDWRNSEIERRTRWLVRSFYERPFLILGRYYFGMKPIPWVPRFQQYWQDRQARFRQLNTRNRGRWAAAAFELTGRPEIWNLESFNESWRRQMKNHFDTIRREMPKIKAQYERVRNEMANGAENDLLGVVNWKNPRLFAATEVQLLLRPPETPEHYSARFSGFLDVPADGEYEFELLSNSLAILRIDGTQLLERRLANGSQPPTVRTAKVALKKGGVPFELFYRLNSGTGRLTVRMRPAGKGEFQLLAAENFTPARTETPFELSGRDGRSYPLIARRGHYMLYTGKRDFTPVEGFRFQTPASRIEWRTGEGEFHPASEFPPMTVLSRDPEKRLGFRFAGQPETELPVLYSDYRSDLVELRPDLALRLWAPAAIYEDEELPVTMETVSRLPFGLEAELDIASARGGRELRLVRLPGKADERFDRSAADVSHKEEVTLLPETLREEEMLEVALRVGGFEFDRKRISVARVSSGTGFGALAELGDIVLILHRMTLGDIREWELERKIGEELLTGRKLLLIAESAAGAEKQARNRLEAKKLELEFLAYDDSETPLESSLFRLLDRIGASTADRAVLVLPSLRRLGSLEPWVRDRYVAALLERLKANRNLRSICLAPGPRRPGEEKEAGELLQSLRRLAREYGVRLLEPGPPGADAKESFPQLLDRLDRNL